MHRERQQVALASIADRTKIKLSLLEGLERDDVSYWPRGIFRRSYIRAYAQAIGLDPDATAREFLARYPDPDEDIQTALAAAHDANGDGADGAPPIRLRFLVNSAIDALSGLRQQAQGPRKNGERRFDSSADPRHVVDVRGHEQTTEESAARGAAVQPMAIALDDGPVDVPVAAHGSPYEVSSADDVADVDAFDGHEPEARSGEFVHAAAAAEDASWHDEPATVERRLTVLSHLCTRLGCAQDLCDVQPVLGDAALAVDAASVTLWLGDAGGRVLAPVFAWGYPEDACARLPRVPRDSDNALARTFRSAGICTVDGSATETGAVVVPVMTSGGCVGALAFELRDGGERRPLVRAFASILAAQLATLIESPVAATRSA